MDTGSGNTIAIVGMSGRFPGANSPKALWRNICKGADSISRFRDAELEDAFDAETRRSPDFVKARGVVENVDQFDAAFFGMHQREAELTDPQHRVFLECAFEAFEDAGYDLTDRSRLTSVFAGASLNTYFLRHVCQGREALDAFTSDYQIGSYSALLGALGDTLATRVAYKFDLRGPAVTVQSACSTSLFAVAQACQSLLTFESDAALAGGASITFPQARGYLSQSGGIGSRSGYCRPFDARADGTVFSSGAAVVLLKRLDDALADSDHIYALIRGVGVNNDGARKAGFTAPSVDGQAAAIRTAIASAQIDASTIGYVECHGTATPVGDPIEFEALTKAFTASESQPRCALGSLKANIGHLDVAAGAAGLIKAALMLRHRTIPPLGNYASPNPGLPSDLAPFYFPTELEPWRRLTTPRRAGVSSFGVGGTNVHVVLEEPPELAPVRPSASRTYVLPLSAKSDAALTTRAAELADHLGEDNDVRLEDVAYTLQRGRSAFPSRAAVACQSREQAIQALRSLQAPKTGAQKPPLAFLFPGQGVQYPGMARRLYENHALFSATIDEGLKFIEPVIGENLREPLLAVAVGKDAAALNRTRLAQPALFLVEYALAQVWMSWGIKPDAMLGHSVGEFAAACTAGVFSFEQACTLVATRAKLMEAMAPGAMLAVRLGEAELKNELGDALDFAALNAPRLCVASGPVDAIEALQFKLASKGVASSPIAVSRAFHSRALDPILDQIREAFTHVRLNEPSIPFVSCVTGDWINADLATSPDYWIRHCRAPVRFPDAVATLASAGAPPFLLEVGPGRTLLALASQSLGVKRFAGLAASAPASNDEDLGDALARLWTAGFEPDWRGAGIAPARKTALPTYPFERRRCWIDRTDRAAAPSYQTSKPDPFPTDSMSDTSMAKPDTARSNGASLRSQIVAILEDLTGTGLADADPDATFLELGFDSLLLGQVARAVEKNFSVQISFRQLLGDVTSIEALAAHVEACLPALIEAKKQTLTNPPAPPPLSDEAPRQTTQGDGLASIVQAQLQAMQALFAEQLRPFQQKEAPTLIRTTTAPPALTSDGIGPERLRLYKPSAHARSKELSAHQQKFIAELIRRADARTPLSKAKTQANRSVHADPRSIAGFHREWKDLVYPVIASRAKGSRIWDIDGNEYIDLVNGYGQTIFGHSPDFVVSALNAQMEAGFPIGPQSELAGEVAELIAEMTGSDRVTFCNTGSEAVMASIRLARAVTGRDKIVVFAADYHGQFDEVLVKSRVGTPAAPIAPGIPNESLANVVVLSYGDQTSLDWIRANGGDLAAVLIEPVQSRRPELRPGAFVQSLRTITANSGTALIFDEVVTGFRTHPGGMQHLFGVRADLATYGKVLGGGMPIGIVAGKARFMDALDGGHWRYGDASVPETAPTFFAGTFVRHPLTLAAAKAVLLHLKAEGPDLQERLDQRSGQLVERINAALAGRNLSTRAQSFSSWFYINLFDDGHLASLFYPYARLLGLHMQEGYPCFLTTAHSEADVDAIADIFAKTLDAMVEAGMLGRSSQAGALEAPASAKGEPASAPLTEPQLEILTAAQMGEEASCAFNESVSGVFEGPVDQRKLFEAINAVVARHQALRGRIGRDDERMHFAPSLAIRPTFVDLSDQANPDEGLALLIGKDARTPFDLWNGPLVRTALVRLGPERHVLIFTAHHIVCDGWSSNLIWRDMAAFYRAFCEGRAHAATAPASFARYGLAQSGDGELAQTQTSDLAYWTTLYADIPPPPDLPTDRPRLAQRSYAGATYSTSLDALLLNRIKVTSSQHGATLFAMLFTALQALLARLSNGCDVPIGVPLAGQSLEEDTHLVGHCVHLLPLRAPIVWEMRFSDHIRRVTKSQLEAFEHPHCTYGRLLRALPIQRSPNRLPLTEIQFNLERLGQSVDFGSAKATVSPNPKAAVNFDFFVNVIESDEGLRIDCDFNTDLFDEATIASWMLHYRGVLEAACANPHATMAAISTLDATGQLLDEHQKGADAPLRHERLHDAFCARVLENPRAVACVDEQGELTYGDLDRISTNLANEIAQRGHGPGALIGVASGRSRWLLIAMLAVSKSGNGYILIDPNEPSERLKLMLERAKIDLILSENADFANLSWCVLALEQVNVAASRWSFQSSAAPDDRACAIDRLGSDEPLAFTHRALLEGINNVIELCELGSDVCAIAMSATASRTATVELLAPLMAGGSVIFVEANSGQNAFSIIERAKKRPNALLQATPTMWRKLLAWGFSSRPGLKMISTGETLSRETAERLVAGGGRLWNMYAHRDAPVFVAGGEFRAADTRVTIGRPLAGAQLYVLDNQDVLAPTGAPGSLCVGNTGAAGAGRSGERGIALVLPDGQIRQCTLIGDIARCLASGQIELCTSERDRQVFRGKIDLEQIAAAARNAPGVEDCAVNVSLDRNGAPALAAFYVAGSGVREEQLATCVMDQLGADLTPSLWMRLDALPQTVAGKLDRTALPAPPLADDPAATKDMPATPLQRELADIWARVLGRDQVGINEPLFALGADSLQVFRIDARMNEKGYVLGVRELMKNPTVATIARLLGDAPPPAVARSSSVSSLDAYRHGARRQREPS